MINKEKISIITGGNAGIGKATAIDFLNKGFTVIIMVRDSEKSRLAYQEILNATDNDKLKMVFVDLASLDSIKIACKEILETYNHIDILINNAGVYKRTKFTSIDDYELSYAVNYLAPVLICNLLLPLLQKSEAARIVNVSSEIYKRGVVNYDDFKGENKYNGNKAYANSKLLVVFFTSQLAKVLRNTNITVNCAHPGVVGTDVFRDYPFWFTFLLKLFILKPEEGAEPLIFLATDSNLTGISGQYFNKKSLRTKLPIIEDEANSLKIWEDTMQMLNIKFEV